MFRFLNSYYYYNFPYFYYLFRYDCTTIGSWCREVANAGDQTTLTDTSVVAVPISNYDEFHKHTSYPKKILRAITSICMSIQR